MATCHHRHYHRAGCHAADVSPTLRDSRITYSPVASVYVGYPNIAQSEINKATLAVTAESLTNPAPDAIDLDLNSVIITDSSYHPQLDAFDGELHLEDSDTPFLSFRIPAVKADNGTKTQVKQRIQIENLDAFTEYTKATLIEEEFTIHLKGKGGLKQGGLPHTTVNYNQKIKNKGIGSLADSSKRR